MFSSFCHTYLSKMIKLFSKLKKKILRQVFLFFFFFFFFVIYWVAPAARGGSQAKGPIGAHGNAGTPTH